MRSVYFLAVIFGFIFELTLLAMPPKIDLRDGRKPTSIRFFPDLPLMESEGEDDAADPYVGGVEDPAGVCAQQVAASAPPPPAVFVPLMQDPFAGAAAAVILAPLGALAPSLPVLLDGAVLAACAVRSGAPFLPCAAMSTRAVGQAPRAFEAREQRQKPCKRSFAVQSGFSEERALRSKK